MVQLVTETNLNLPNKRVGKVRDIYETTLPNGDPGLLIVATDRVSAFDVVLNTGLPGKGIVLTQISKFWFDFFADDVSHHLVTTNVDEVPGLTDEERRQLRGRVKLCRKANVLPVECIARGYITGSGWKDYQKTGKVCGIPLPMGLRNSDRLDEPLFTPSTKAEQGDHDENISFDEGVEIVGEEKMSWLRDMTLSLYNRAREHAIQRGIILADTKLEFGVQNGSNEPILIDEIFTPDSSRFWPSDDWEPGREQASYDKQIVRNYLETLVSAGTWDKTPPGPDLPDEVIDRTMGRYLEAYEHLTGQKLEL
ncbi:MAG: phosphoribosylaminoimidazolesuccinocarboxamide synthase [Gammaproteobacteria bacterium]|nr:phosphoribosylaminoimidazolesuccinocarboxamide synthase [Gammaproteobacteria bacterium]